MNATFRERYNRPAKGESALAFSREPPALEGARTILCSQSAMLTEDLLGVLNNGKHCLWIK